MTLKGRDADEHGRIPRSTARRRGTGRCAFSDAPAAEYPFLAGDGSFGRASYTDGWGREKPQSASSTPMAASPGMMSTPSATR